MLDEFLRLLGVFAGGFVSGVFGGRYLFFRGRSTNITYITKVGGNVYGRDIFHTREELSREEDEGPREG